MKICQLTTVHQTFDVRIFFKECRSLRQAGHDVYLISSNNQLNDASRDGIMLIAVPRYNNRFYRVIFGSISAYKRVKAIKPDVVHFHDVELIPVALLLKRKGYKVVYDVHEDMPASIMTKTWLPKYLRRFVAYFIKNLERYAAKKVDTIVTATPYIHSLFEKRAQRTVCVQNYPMLEEYDAVKQRANSKERMVCFVGAVSPVRGYHEMVDAVTKSKAGLYLAGQFVDGVSENKLAEHHDITCLGVLPRDELSNIYQKAIAGLLLYQPAPNHIHAQPNKLFEYMAAGLPVIASNFPGWEALIRKHNCGLVVDPTSIPKIVKAIDYLIDNSDLAMEMGERGRKAVATSYCWDKEKEKLLSLYDTFDT